MDLAYFANLAEIIGTTTIVVSLIYVAVQVRQSTRATRLISSQNISHELREATALLANESEMAEIHLQGIANANSLTRVEKHRFYIILSALYRVYENAYYQKQEGVLDSDVWEGLVGQILLAKDSPGYQTFWSDRKNIFSEAFRNFIENELPSPGLDTLSPYRGPEDRE